MVPAPARPYDEPQRILRPASIRREVEASLSRVGVERIDLYQFHWPDAIGTPIEESSGEMARLVEEGKVRAAGVSNFDIALFERAEAIRHVDSLQPPFSLIRRDAGADWRRGSAPFVEPHLSPNLALRDALRPVAERHGVTVSAVAVAWTLAWPGVTGEDLAEITQTLLRTGAGSGPVESDRRVSARVAMLGTGRMGSALARRLAGAGLEPALWNRTRARAEQVGAGRVVATAAEAVRDADVVCFVAGRRSSPAAPRPPSSVPARCWGCSARCAMSAPWAVEHGSSWWPTRSAR